MIVYLNSYYIFAKKVMKFNEIEIHLKRNKLSFQKYGIKWTALEDKQFPLE